MSRSSDGSAPPLGVRPSTRRVPLAVALGYAGLFVFGLVDGVRGPVFPDVLAAFDLSDAQGAWFFFLPAAAALVNNLALTGWIERKIGRAHV